MGYVIRAKEVRQLRCPLTAAEVEQRAERIADLLADADQREDELAAVKARYKSAAQECERERRRLVGEYRTRSTVRDVDCELQLDLDAKRAQWVRTDTGEVILERGLRDEERQGGLFDEESGDPDGEGDPVAREGDLAATAGDRAALAEHAAAVEGEGGGAPGKGRRARRATSDAAAH